jgi:hypothetical protein
VRLLEPRFFWFDSYEPGFAHGTTYSEHTSYFDQSQDVNHTAPTLDRPWVRLASGTGPIFREMRTCTQSTQSTQSTQTLRATPATLVTTATQLPHRHTDEPFLGTSAKLGPLPAIATPSSHYSKFFKSELPGGVCQHIITSCAAIGAAVLLVRQISLLNYF